MIHGEHIFKIILLKKVGLSFITSPKRSYLLLVRARRTFSLYVSDDIIYNNHLLEFVIQKEIILK